MGVISPHTGVIAGQVLDTNGQKPLNALIEFPKTSIAAVNSNQPGGGFRVNNVPTGIYTVTATLAGYLTGTQTITVKDSQATSVVFNLTPAAVTSPPTGVIAGQVLDTNGQNPLNARIEFPNTDIAAVNSDQPGGGFRVNDVPVGVYTVTATLAGYLTGTQTITVRDSQVTSMVFNLTPVNVPTDEFGSLSGTVTDAATRRPLRANISFADPNLASVTTDSLTGFYSVVKVPVGPAAVKATADGYFPAQATAAIVANGSTVQDFALSPPASQTGQISGVVTDMQTKAPLAATISFPSTTIPSVTSDPATGLYKATAPISPLVVACSLPGYVTQMSPSPVVIQSNAPAVYNFRMLKLGTEITLTNDAIHFAFNSSDIQPDGYPALDEWVKLMKNNPYMTAEIQGHTDAVGSDEYNQGLSERRAQSVVAYLTGHGVDGSRLTAIGYGKTRLVVQTQSANAQNRRVIFKVTGEAKK
jgi:outer membrane protein OmpA-like peptidoglycan-associated protein